MCIRDRPETAVCLIEDTTHASANALMTAVGYAVSYTHLDVYKRQGMPNAIGSLIAQSDLKDLGVHTEMYVDAFVDIAKAGKITGDVYKRQIEHGIALLALDDNRNNLILESTVLDGLVSLQLAVVSEILQHLAGDGAVAVLLLKMCIRDSFYTLHSRSRYCFSAYTTLPYPIHYWIA